MRGRDRRLIARAHVRDRRRGTSPAVSRALGRAAYAADDVAVLCRLDGGEAYIAEAAGGARAPRAPATTRRARATSRTCSPRAA